MKSVHLVVKCFPLVIHWHHLWILDPRVVPMDHSWKTFHYSVNWFHSGNAFTVEKSDILFLSLPLCCYYYRALGSEATTETTPLIQLFWCLDFLCVGCRRRSRCNQLSFFSSGDPVCVCTSFFCLKKMQSAREVNHVLFSFVFSSIILSTTSLTIFILVPF